MGEESTVTIIRANLETLGVSTNFYAAFLFSIRVASAVVWGAVGVVIFLRRSDDWMALFTSLTLLTFGIYYLYGGVGALAERYPALGLPVAFLATFGAASFALFFYIFPDGRLVPRWTGLLLIPWVVHEALFYFANDSILNIEESVPLLDFVADLSLLSVGIGAQIYRYMRVSDAAQRQQTKWVVYGTVSSLLGLIGLALLYKSSATLEQFGSPYTFAIVAGMRGFLLLIPLSICVAILRHRLWDIDIVINRTLVYGALTASIIAVYALVVGSLEALLQERDNLVGNSFISLFAAGCVALVFVPLRQGLQRWVNRLMYGERDDPYTALSRLGRRLEATLTPTTVLHTIAETVAGALKLPYAAIAIKAADGFKVAAVHGSPTGEEISLPLNYVGETVGQLILSPRAPGETFSSTDRRLLEDLARQAEVAVHAVRLNTDLQLSRERLIGAREEERRRLRRDLHDGLGPTLGGLALGLDAAISALPQGASKTEALLRELRAQTQEAVSDIRRLVYGLRPPALDDLGLVPAIRQQASKHGLLTDDLYGGTMGEADHKNSLLYCVEAPKQLPPLPAAAEVACYRIAQEAITNVSRHAKARRCRISIAVDEVGDTLVLEVKDDGVGMPQDRHAGVGMSSMRERAEELGGRLAVEEAVPEGGTRVLARLPLPGKEEQ